MAYATLTDLRAVADEAELVRLTDDEGAGSAVDAVLTQALADASDEIDGYIATRYAAPFSSVPPILRRYCIDLALAALYARRPMGPPEHIEARRKSALAFLTKVAAGAISLGSEDPDPPKAEARIASAPRRFGRRSLREF
jgi:phage gp36-like protein